ncbi:ABC transporter, solute-binding protein [Marvinbryantia formatexigens DSM 14469]|uniref:ABC transporter, solute-binding protein n=2 Tax=Marvinbryantia TaxID=248744 RepID=C6LF05_9FIRM|nr:ABC transporter, solute-binding protein [Marvinbryantia formatexigens DSM 14469]
MEVSVMSMKKLLGFGFAASMVLSLGVAAGAEDAALPTIDQITVGEDYTDITASIKVLTNRTDIVDTVYKGYAEQFMELYPNITVEYEAITDYEESLILRLMTGDWGDLCFIPTSVNRNELADYFIPLGDFDTLDPVYNFVQDKSYEGTVYGIANGGTAGGVVYNKRIWDEAGITELPATPDEFLEDLQIIKDNTDAVPLYTNFAAGWTMGAWDQYIGVAATGDADFMNYTIVHQKDPFAKRDDMTGPYAVYYTLYEAVARGLVEEDPASSDWESSKGAINKGEIATMVLGSWAVQQCKDAGETPDDVRYMPFPITVDGKRYAGAGGNYSFGINNKAETDNQIAAMVYLKWLIEESTIYLDEGSIPARKDGELPDTLADFEGVELLADNPAHEGEETLFNDINNESEVGINNNDYPDCEILEAALYGSSTLDELMADWNEKWTAAQELYEVEIIE